MPRRGHRVAQAEVAHHRDDDGVAGERLGVAQLQRGERHHAVAVDGLAVLVDGDHPVAVAVERQAEVGAAHEQRAGEIAG